MEVESIIIIVVFFGICFGSMGWSLWRRAHGKSDKLPMYRDGGTIIDDFKNSKPHRIIVKTEILEQTGGRSYTYGHVRPGLLGGAVGSSVTKHRGDTTFRVYYEDGHTEIEKVMDGIWRWETLIKYLPEQK